MNKTYELNELCLEITNACFMNCLHCSADAGSPLEDEMNFSEIKNVVSAFTEMGGKTLELSGGEPLIHQNIFKIIEHAKEHDLEVRIYTSGFLGNEIIQEVVHSPIDKIIFNLQGASKSIHENVTRTKGSYDKVIRNIKLLKSKDFWVGIHFVPMKPNIYGVEDIMHLCIDDLNISELAFLRFVPQGRGMINREQLEPSKEELEYLFNFLNRVDLIYKNRTRIGRPYNIRAACFNRFKPEKCNAGITKCLIKPNGDVAPCPAFKQNASYAAGNVKKNTLTEIWETSSLWREFREFEYSKLTGPCTKCNKLSSCKGGCTAQRILAWNNIYQGPDPSCILDNPEVESFGIEKLLQERTRFSESV